MNSRFKTLHISRFATIAIAAIVIAACLLTLLAATIAAIPVQEGHLNAYGSLVGGDFLVFYSAARIAATDGGTAAYNLCRLYEMQDTIAGPDTQSMPFVYPPIALFLWLPFGFFSYLFGFYLWLVATLGSLTAVLRKFSRQWMVTAIVMASPLILKAGVTGQSGNLRAALIGAGLLLLYRHPFTAGVMLGGLAFKPHLALVLPICLAAGGHWRTFASTGLTAGFLTIASVGVFGVGSWNGCLENSQMHAGDFFIGGGDQWDRIPTVVVSVQRLTGNLSVAWMFQIVLGIAAAVVVGVIWYRTNDGLARSLGLAAAMFLVSPKALYYDMAVFSIPLTLLIAELLGGRVRLRSIVLSVTIWALPALAQVSRWLDCQLGPLFLVAALGYAASRCQTAEQYNPV